MAAPGGLGVVLLVLMWQLVAVVGGLGRSLLLSSSLTRADCVPDDFEPPQVMVNAASECRQFLMNVTMSSGPFPSHRARRAGYLQCVVQRLGITNEDGIDESALTELISSFSSNTSWLTQQSDNVRDCISAMSLELNADQQGVFVLACAKKLMWLDCRRRLSASTSSGDCVAKSSLTSLCRGARSVFSNMTALMTCMETAFPDGKMALFSGPLDGLCSRLNEANREFDACLLRENDMVTDEGAVDFDTLRAAIEQTSSDEATAVLQECTGSQQPSSTVDSFLDCWIDNALVRCAFSKASRLALALETP